MKLDIHMYYVLIAVVSEDPISSYVVGVFSSYEKAERAVDNAPTTYNNGLRELDIEYYITEHHLDGDIDHT